ncbi:hypothetical protein ADK70_10080 [Streptomyces rimosus subsp. pseudoverticillatus]|nr:hypothetical protein ADK70_10080 [Streptomyces rimosus subsp. pseudoverticillatus]
MRNPHRLVSARAGALHGRCVRSKRTTSTRHRRRETADRHLKDAETALYQRLSGVQLLRPTGRRLSSSPVLVSDGVVS